MAVCGSTAEEVGAVSSEGSAREAARTAGADWLIELFLYFGSSLVLEERVVLGARQLKTAPVV